MAFANLLRTIFSGAPKAGEHPFVVVCAHHHDGVSPEEGFALRELINSYRPTEWRFLNPGSFVVLYENSSHTARAKADALVASLQAFGQPPVLGVGIAEGSLFAEFSADGRLNSWPIGGAINTATLAARSGAPEKAL